MQNLQLRDFHHRALIAIPIPIEIQHATRQLIRNLSGEARNFRFINLEQLHVSLQFLGSAVSTESLEAIISTLVSTLPEISSFKLTLSSISFGSPGQRNPNTILWNLASSELLMKLTKKIHNSIKKLGLEDVNRLKDRTRNFQRVKIGKTKHSTSKSFGKKINIKIDNMQIEPITFKVSEISIIKSTVNKFTPVYSRIWTTSLAK